MKRKILLLLALVFGVALQLYAEVTETDLYHGGVYGQEFWLTEYREGEKSQLSLIIDDGGPSKSHFDNNYRTAYVIYSKWFSDKKELNENIQACKDFFMYSLNFVYLNEIPEACAMELSCKLVQYNMKKIHGEDWIFFRWDCDDLISLFDVISEYHRHGKYDILRQHNGKQKTKK